MDARHLGVYFLKEVDGSSNLTDDEAFHRSLATIGTNLRRHILDHDDFFILYP